MMISSNVDLGQLIIASLVAIVGFLIKKTWDKFESRIDKFESRLDNQDKLLMDLVRDLTQLKTVIGMRKEWAKNE